MAKGKSSASSNTRKKHAAKKAGEEAPQPKQRGQKESKMSKAQRKAMPKVKQFIPPPKPPAPPIPDPLDSQGLGRTLPPELVVVLRRLGKKDEVTRRKGIEELREGWVEPVLRGGDELELELKEEALVGALPVWLHHLSTLLHSSSHRAPSLALFSLILSIPSCMASVLNTLELGLLPGTQHRDLIGSWLVASLEEGRRPGGGAGIRKWGEVVSFGQEANKLDLNPNLSLLVEYLASSILTPAELHADLHPQPVSAVNTPSTSSPAPSARVLAKALKQQSRPSAAAVPTLSIEEPEDVDEERWGRYRLTGLMGLTWLLQNLPGPMPEALEKLVQLPSLWASLSSEESIGLDQPGVRRAAYALLAVLVERHSATVANALPVLSQAVLGSCWVEKDGSVWEVAGQTLVVFLTKYRQAWDLAADSDESDSDDDDNPAFISFLTFLTDVCPLHPHATYPLLLVIVSTLPASVLPLETDAVANMFSQLWSPAGVLSTHSLPGSQSAFQVFLQAVLDTAAYLTGKAWKVDQDVAAYIVTEEVAKKAWVDGVLQGGGKSRRGEVEAEMVGKVLARAAALDASLVEAAMPIIREETLKAAFSVLPRVGAIVDALSVETGSLRADLLQLAIDASAQEDRLAQVWQLLADFAVKHPACFTDAQFHAVSQQLVQQPTFMFENLPQAAEIYSTFSTVDRSQGEIARALTSVLSPSSNLPREQRLQSVQALLARGATGDWLDEAALEVVELALAGDKQCLEMLPRIKASADTASGMLAMITTAVHTLTEDLLCPVDTPTERLDFALAALQVYAQDPALQSPLHVQALVAVHHLVAFQDNQVARAIWEHAKADDEAVLTSLAGLLSNTSCVVSPVKLVAAATDPSRILPSSFAAELDQFASRPPQITLPILDPLVPYDDRDVPLSVRYDTAGRSSYARHAEALIAVLYTDRTLASSSHLFIALTFATLASDELAVVNGGRGAFRGASPDYLERVVQDAGQLLSYVLATGKHPTVQGLKGSADPVQGLLCALQEAGGDINARVFRNVLAGALRSSAAADAEEWLAYGMTLCEKDTELSIAILSAVKDLLLDSKPYETAQNRLASTLTGVSLKKANTQGVTYLRLLAASAPPPGAASTFIPQQRAMFVMRHVAGWLTDEDEDLVEEVEARVAEVFASLAPIVQDVPGAHWDSVFDLIETGLEGSLADETTYGLLYHSLVLLTTVKDLCLTNKALRVTWPAKTHLELVLKLFLEQQPVVARSEPLEKIQEMLVDLLHGADVVADYAQLCSLLRTSPLPIQQTAYSLLHDLTVRKTGQLVLDVEASVAEAEEGHESKTIELAPEVVEVVRQGKGVAWAAAAALDGAHLVILGQLLAWMTLFDHFEDASNTLRGAYLDQIRNEGLVEQGLLPLLFEMLGVSEVGAWNFAASTFAVDEFYVNLLQVDELADLTPLASHVFYRSLTCTPSIIRSFFEACKDRQLSLSLLQFTSRHYSPVIIHHEFAALKVPAAIAQLADEGLNVKVVTGGGGVGSAEAVASYEIDEQPMEIGIRLPSEFPLKGVEVRDLRRVGVPENKWRGWLMGVQQLITSRNGLMLEALTVFKKNVALHFDGVVECAICYSIISLTDRTLPTKPCRTCKNRFHSSCLFKWFNSSHSSSCPMCRSLF